MYSVKGKRHNDITVYSVDASSWRRHMELEKCPSRFTVVLGACAVAVTATLPPESAVEKHSSTIAFSAIIYTVNDQN